MSAARIILLARSANEVCRWLRNAEAADCNFCSICGPVRGSKLFTTSPVAGFVVAIAMLIPLLRLWPRHNFPDCPLAAACRRAQCGRLSILLEICGTDQ